MSDEVLYVKADRLKGYCKLLFEKAGMPAEEANMVADVLVEADLIGVESHGVSRVVSYLQKLRGGGVRPHLQLKTVMDSPSTGVYDGCNSMGAVVGSKVMQTAIEKAVKTGIGFVTVFNSSHYGTAGYYARLALHRDMIGFTASNSVSQMAPWGGKTPFFGTNPFAIAIPADKQLPIVADMATSHVARGKIIMAAKNKQPIPLGWARTKEGEDTTDAEAALTGCVLPFAGAKGYAIATMIEIMTGILSGSVFGPRIKGMAHVQTPSLTSHCFMAINIANFSPAQEFKSNVDKMILEIKQNPKAKDVTEIFLPGEIEARTKMNRLSTGIPMRAAILNELKNEGSAADFNRMLA